MFFEKAAQTKIELKTFKKKTKYKVILNILEGNYSLFEAFKYQRPF
jgi:hypothetical protein